MWDYIHSQLSSGAIGFTLGFLVCYFTLGRRKDDHT